MVDVNVTYNLMKLFYKGVLRDIILKVVLDTKTEWDDQLLEVADKIFEYNPHKKGELNGIFK